MFGEDAGFSDFFETFFSQARGGGAGAGGEGGGRRARTPRPRAGADLEHPVSVSLADAYRGTTLDLTLRSPDGKTRRLEVKVPPGVRTGSRVRVSGQGGQGQAGGATGDLYLVIEVQPDPRFERRGDDLYTQVQAPLEAMLLGGEARVPTPDGRTLALTIPAGTQDGRVFVLRRQGMPHLGDPDRRGDLHAAVHARLPERLTDRQRELIEEFAKAGVESTDGAFRR
jgi:curved DNA-binding protein